MAGANKVWDYPLAGISVDLSRTEQAVVGPSRVVGVDTNAEGGARRWGGMKSFQLSTVGLLQQQDRQPTFMKYAEIQKGAKAQKLRGFVILDGSSLWYHYYDTESSVVAVPHFIATFNGAASDLDVASNGKYMYLTSLGTNGKAAVLSHDGSNFRDLVDMGALVADGGANTGVTNFATGGKLKDGDYAVTWRRYNPLRNVYDGFREIKDAKAALGGAVQKFTSGTIGPSGDFLHIQLFRSVAGGTRMYLESTHEYAASTDTAVGMTFGTLTDEQLQTKNDLYEPVLDAVGLSPEAVAGSSPRIASYQGITIQKLEGIGVDDTLSDLVYSPMHVKAPENFPADNTFPLPVEESPVLSFVEAADYLFAMTPIATIRFQRSGSRMAINKTSLGYGPTSRFAAVAVGPAIIVASPRGLYMIEGATGELQLFNAVSRLFTHDGEWQPDMLADLRGSDVTPRLHLAFDEPSSLVFITNNAKQECVVLNMKNGRINTLQDWAYTLSTTGPHPSEGGAKRAWFAGVKTGTTPAFVHTDKLFFPNSFREGRLTMSGTIDPTTSLNGTATGGTKSSLIDTSNFFGDGVFGSFIHIFKTALGVTTRSRHFAIPGPAMLLDDFDRADAGNLGTNWSQIGSGASDYFVSGYFNDSYFHNDYFATSTTAAISIVGNKAQHDDLGTVPVDYAALWATGITQDDYDVEAEFTATSPATPWFHVFGRTRSATAADREGYLMTATQKTFTLNGRTLAANKVAIEYSDSSGTITTMAQSSFTFLTGTTYTLKFSLRDNILKAFVDGNEIVRFVLANTFLAAGATPLKKSDDVTDHMDSTRLDDTRVLVVYRTNVGALGAGYARVARVIGDDITWGTEQALSGADDLFYISVAALTDSFALAAYYNFSNAGDGEISELTITGTTVSVGAGVTYLSSLTTLEGARFNRMTRVDDTHGLVAYSDWTDSKKGILELYDSGTNTIIATSTFHSSAIQEVGTLGALNVTEIGGGLHAVVYGDASSDNKGLVRIFDTTALSSISLGAPVAFHSAAGGLSSRPDVTAFSATQIVIVYFDVLNQRSRSVVGTVSGTTVTMGSSPASSDFATAADHLDITTMPAGETTWRDGTDYQPLMDDAPAPGFTASWTLNGSSVDSLSFEYQVAALDATHVVATWYNTTDDDLNAAVGTVSGTNITWGAINSFKTGQTGTNPFLTSAPLDSTHIVVIYGDRPASPGNSFARVLHVTGTTISAGAEKGYGNGSAGQDADWHSVSRLDSTHFVVAFVDRAGGSSPQTGRARVGQVTGTTISFGAAVTHSSSDANTGQEVIGLSATKFVVLYNENANNKAVLKVGAVLGVTISYGTALDLLDGSGTGDAFGYFSTQMDMLDSSHFIMFVHDQIASTYFAQVGHVTGLTISLGAAVIVTDDPSGGGNLNGVVAVDSTTVVVSYSRPSGMFGRVMKVTGSTIEMFPTSSISSSGQSNLAKLTPTKVFLVHQITGASGIGDVVESLEVKFTTVAGVGSKTVSVYRDGGDGGKGKAKVGTVTASTITYAASHEFAATDVDWIATADLDGTKMVVAYRDTGDSNKGKVKVGTVAGNDITFGAASEFLSVDGALWIDIAKLDSTHIVVVYEDTADFSHGTAKIGTVSGIDITFGAEHEFISANAVSDVHVAALSPTVFVVAYVDISTGNGDAKVGVVSGTDITYGASGTTFDSNVGEIHIVKMTATVFSVAYSETTANEGRTRTGSVLGTTISYGSVGTFDAIDRPQSINCVPLSSTQFGVLWRNKGDSNHGSSMQVTLSGLVPTFGNINEFLGADGAFSIDSTVDASGKVIVAYLDNSNDNRHSARVGNALLQPDLSAQKLFLCYRDFGLDNFGKARIGTVTAGVVVWDDYVQYLLPTTPGGNATAVSNRCQALDAERGFVFFQDFEDGQKGKGVVVTVTQKGVWTILTDAGYAGFGSSFNGDGTEMILTDNWKVINEDQTIGLIPALSTAVAAGDTYSIAPIPFRLTLWPLDAQGGQLDYFQRRSIQTMGIAIGDYVPADVTVNSKFRMQSFTEGSTTEDVGKEVAISTNKGVMWGKLASFGLVVQPGFECFSSDEDFNVLSAKVSGTQQDTQVDD